jgi:hypothetical protein
LVETQRTSTEVIAADETPLRADLAVAIAGQDSAEATGALLQSAEEGLARHFPDRIAALLVADQIGSGADAGTLAVGDRMRVVRVAVPPDLQRSGLPLSRAQSLRLLFQSAAGLGVTALAVVDADHTAVDPGGIGRLLRPLVERGAEFVAPYYVRPRFAGAITSSMAYPFARALYGRRLRFPTGGDFACSARFMQFCLHQDPWGADGSRTATDLWLVHRALLGGFKLSQAALGPRSGTAADEGAELSTVLARVLGTLFGEAERNVQFWQRIRGSEPVELLGIANGLEEGGPTIDLAATAAAFRLGLGNLMPVWEAVLPPTTLLELRKLGRRGDDQLRLPDALWARIVYDFAIAFHARVMSREHLLSAFTPLYLGWLASHVAELEGSELSRSERRIEELCLRFEAEKPYLISRWRWPDRFSP